MDSTMNATETNILLARYQAGDRQALNEVLEKYQPFLARVVQLRMDEAMCGRVESSDVVKETQREAIRRVDEYLEHRPMSFRMWLRATACHRLAMLERHHPSVSADGARENPLHDPSSLALARCLLHGNSSTHAPPHEPTAHLCSVVAALPAVDREILLMRHFEELTNQEAAEALGVDPLTASTRYGQALLRLRDEWQRSAAGRRFWLRAAEVPRPETCGGKETHSL
jgi:RNA polymerase sigma-70 factor (ECF subfamily)